MVKKLVCFGLVIAMLFTLAACNKESELDKYKKIAKTEIQEYADSKDENNYTAENWLRLKQAAKGGQVAIDEAKDELVVKEIIDSTKRKIDIVMNKSDEEIIGLGGVEGLDAETELAIIKAYCSGNNAPYKGQESVDKNSIGGIYISDNGFVVINFKKQFSTGMDSTYTMVGNELLIYHSAELKVWKDEVLYSFYDACYKWFFTVKDLKEIVICQKEWHPEYY